MDLQEQMKEYSALKALQIILALAEQKGWVNLSDIAEATGLSPSTVHRILQDAALFQKTKRRGSINWGWA